MYNFIRSRPISMGTLLATATALASMTFSTSASAQAATPDTLVSVCSGVSLPPSVVTGIIDPIVTGIYGPIETNLNSTLGLLSGLIPGLPAPLSVDINGLLTTAASGSNIGLSVVAQDGTLVGPSDECNAQAGSYTLDNPAGIAIGGNAITGLGDNGEQASAGEIDSIAIGNRASTDATATGSIALGTDATVGAGAVGSIAFGQGASATAANSIALGAGSVASRGVVPGSVGEVSIGSSGAERQITNVAPGTIGTDAVNLDQLQAVAAAIPVNTVQYDDATHSIVTLDGAGGTLLTNLTTGALTATSTDAVNGSQLFATNQQVTNNTTAIANLSLSISNGAMGPVQYSNPATPTVPNGGVQTNDLTLVGAAAGPVGLHNVGDGLIAAGSTDAVNGGQIYQLSLGISNAVLYETDINGNRTNNVLLIGGDAAQPVTISGLAPGEVSATSTQAVNGSQLFATDAIADAALALGQNSVQYDNAAHDSVTVNPGGPAAGLHNVAGGVAATDAVNVAQLNMAANNAVSIANSYTDARIAALDFDIKSVRRDARSGSASALAAAALPQSMSSGRTMVSAGVGTYAGRSAFAIGASHVLSNGKSVFKLGVTYDASEKVGANAGVGVQF